MKRRLLQMILILFCTTLLAAGAAAHCEIPCGIYDDEARITILLEHVATVEKSMNQITAIEKEKKDPHNVAELRVVHPMDFWNKNQAEGRASLSRPSRRQTNSKPAWIAFRSDW